MMKHIHDIARSLTNKMVLLVMLAGVSCTQVMAQATDFAQYIDPMIGTLNGAHTFPGPCVPWGMVQMSPYTNGGSISGFFAYDGRIYGFVHTNVSGPGCSGWGNLLLMATTGEIKTKKEEFSSVFSDRDSEARAGYFSTRLHSYGIDAEQTCTKRVGVSRFTFPAHDGDANILINVSGGITKTINAYVEIRDDSTIVGYKHGGDFWGIPTYETLYFFARFSEPMTSAGVWSGDTKYNSDEQRAVEGDDIGGFMRFTTRAGEQVMVKVGISYVSIDNAQLNLETELPHWDFNRVVDEAYADWNTTINRVEIEDDNEENKTKFYTAMYHSLLHPNVFNDVNGEYPDVANGGIKKAEGFTRYTLYSLWDTYRTVHPFLTLMYPEQQNDMVQSMLEHYKENGSLPLWEIAGTDVQVMIGDPASVVVADTYLKGLQDFDINLAYEAVTRHAFSNSDSYIGRPENAVYNERGFIPHGDRRINYSNAGVSLMQEYCVADAAVGAMAAGLCHPIDAMQLQLRAQSFKQSFDEETRFFRPRVDNGDWLEPFDPLSKEHRLESGRVEVGGAGFTEGTAWNYRFFIPHDQQQLVELMGGPSEYLAKLQQYFDEDHYVWNQHNLAYPFLFNYVPGQQWRSIRLTHKLMAEDFTAEFNGIPGNDDAGGLSAWFLFAGMGLYPDNPSSANYLVTSPLFNKITLHLDDRYYPGEKFVIEAAKSSADDIYVQNLLLNGNPFNSAILQHSAIVAGGSLDYELHSTPATMLSMPPMTEIEPVQLEILYNPDTLAMRVSNPVDSESLEVQFSLDPAFCTGLETREVMSPNSIIAVQGLPAGEILYYRARYRRTGALGAWSNIQVLRTAAEVQLPSAGRGPLSILEFGPNPVDDRVMLLINSDNETRLTLKVYSNRGDLQKQQELQVQQSVPFMHALELGALASGTYHIVVSGAGEEASISVSVLR